MTACLTDLEKPGELKEQLAVIATLRMSFRKLPTTDSLLDWLGQYAAYSIQQLQLQRDFHNLLSESPTLSSRMVLSLNPASQPPWRTAPLKYSFAHYSPSHGYEEGYD